MVDGSAEVCATAMAHMLDRLCGSVGTTSSCDDYVASQEAHPMDTQPPRGDTQPPRGDTQPPRGDTQPPLTDQFQALGDLLGQYHSMCDARGGHTQSRSSHNHKPSHGSSGARRKPPQSSTTLAAQDTLFYGLTHVAPAPIGGGSAMTNTSTDRRDGVEKDEALHRPPAFARSTSLLYALLTVVDPSVGLLSDAEGVRCLEAFGHRAVTSMRSSSAHSTSSAPTALSLDTLCDSALSDTLLGHIAGVLGVGLYVRRPDGKCDTYSCVPEGTDAVLVVWEGQQAYPAYALVCFKGVDGRVSVRCSLHSVRCYLCALALAERSGLGDARAMRRMMASEVRDIAAAMALLPLQPTEVGARRTRVPSKATLLDSVSALVQSVRLTNGG
jgi:hypothetical protein